MEQTLIHRPAIGRGGVEDLARVSLERLAQPLARQDYAAGVHQPQILANACVLQQEEPAIYLRPRRGGRETAAEREVARLSFLAEATELDPGVAHAPLMAAEQEVPGHFLARVTVGLDTRGLELRVEQQRQRQRQHFGLAGAVVAAQEQVAVAEPEFLAVVMEEFHQPQAQRLPARQSGLGQCSG